MNAKSAHLSFSIENLLGLHKKEQQHQSLQEQQEDSPHLSSEGAQESKLQKDSNCQRRKRRRILFTESQVGILKSVFLRQRYLSSEGRKKLAESLSLSPKQVKTWFQNYRYKCRRSLDDGDIQTVEGHEVNMTSNLLGRTAMAAPLRIPPLDRPTALVTNPYSSINQLNTFCDRHSLMNHSYRFPSKLPHVPYLDKE